MSMEMTWLDFQFSTNNQNGRQVATKFFFQLTFYFFHNSRRLNFFFNLNFIFFTIHIGFLKLGIYRSSEGGEEIE